MRRPSRSAALLAWACGVGLLSSLGTLVAPATATATAAAPGAVRAELGGQSVWAHFSNPHAHHGRDTTIQNEVERLIRATPAGQTIHGTIYSLSVQPVARALVAAQKRGVHVQILLDGVNAKSKGRAVAIIRQLDGVHFCTYAPASYGSAKKAGTGCVTTNDDGELHVKLFTFSQTTDPNGVLRGDVSWFGSANMTYASGADQFNNATTVYGDVALYDGLNGYFADLWQRRHYPGNDYFDLRSGRGYGRAPAATFYASPEGRRQTDTIAARLADVTPTGRCKVRIAMAFVTAGRPQLLRAVDRLAARGCRVTMVVSGKGSRIRMDRDVYVSLLRAGVTIRRTGHVHDKFLTVYARYGSRYRFRVYTGSQNWSGSALSDNDELFVKLAPETSASHPLYDGYRRHFDDAWALGKGCSVTKFPCR